MRKAAFAPVVDADTRLLILGSLPGDASLKAGQYYGHPRNGFWRLLSPVVARDLVSLSYPDRLAALREAGVGLWDVLASARRPGSLDGAIREATANPLRDYIATHPRLRAVAFNGKTAARLGRLAIGDLDGIELIDLPSSSPAYTIAFEEKVKRWAMLASLACPAKVATLQP